MAIKSILDIDVNDAKFRQFADSFNKYRETLSRVPKEWKEAGAASERTAEIMQELMGIIAANAAYEDVFHTNLDKSGKELKHHQQLWGGIAKHTDKVKRDVKETLTDLLRWGTRLSVIGFGVGIGGLFGLREIAKSVSAERNEALGTASNIGQEQAFQLWAGRIMPNAQGIFRHAYMARAPGTPENALASILGISTKGGTFNYANRLLEAVQDLVKRTPENLIPLLTTIYPQLAESGFSTAGLQSLRDISRQELVTSVQGSQRSAREFALNAKQGLAWANFLSSFGETFKEVRAQIERWLIPLLGPLQKLMKTIGDLTVKFLKSGAAAKAIQDFSDWVKKAADYLASGKFQASFDNFIKSVNSMALGMSDFGAGISGLGHAVLHPFDALSGDAQYYFNNFNNWMRSMAPAGSGARQQMDESGLGTDKPTNYKYPWIGSTALSNSYYVRQPATQNYNQVKIPPFVVTVRVSNATGSDIISGVNQLFGGS